MTRERMQGDRAGASAARRPAFHDLLLGYRAAAQETHEDLAAAVGVSVKTIEAYERAPTRYSARTPPADVFSRLCAHFQAKGALSPAAYAAFAAARAARRRRQGVPARPAPTPAQGARPTLPRRLTALLGRDELSAALVALLTGHARPERPARALVTLIGPGGIGKTHLALEVAARCKTAFPDGVWWAELAAVGFHADVADSIAAQIGATDPPGVPPGARLRARLEEARALLVLDNFEHVLDAGLLVADLLAHCPHLSVLATSRVPLHLHGEREQAVPPLQRAAAGQLFVERVRDLRPDFAPAEDAEALDSICARLDDVPLALELAARQMRRYETPQALLAALAPALPQLTGGPRDAPERQQTMQAAIAWSDALLAPAARCLLRRLVVCRGGCIREAALVLGQNLLDVEGAIATLVDHGLVQRATQTRQERLTLFEVVREYGLEQLVASGEEDEARRRHAVYYLALAEEAQEHFQTPQQTRWDRLLEPEHDNLRAALAWTIEASEGILALRLVVALRRHWSRKGQIHEARRWMDGALAIGRDVPDDLRARGLAAATQIATEQNDDEAAERLAAECHALASGLGDPALLCDALNSWGALAFRRGDYGRAISLHEQALEVAEAAGDVREIAGAHHLLGIAYMLHWDAATSEVHYEQASALFRDIGDVRGYGFTRFGVGVTRTMVADFAGALAGYRTALTVARRLRDPDLIIYVVYGIAAATGLTGAPQEAGQLFGAAARLCEDVGMALPPSFLSLLETTKEMIRGTMHDPEAFDRWHEEGQAMSQADTLALARRSAQDAQARLGIGRQGDK